MLAGGDSFTTGIMESYFFTCENFQSTLEEYMDIKNSRVYYAPFVKYRMHQEEDSEDDLEDDSEDDEIPSYDITENIYLAPTVKYIDLDEK